MKTLNIPVSKPAANQPESVTIHFTVDGMKKIIALADKAKADGAAQKIAPEDLILMPLYVGRAHQGYMVKNGSAPMPTSTFVINAETFNLVGEFEGVAFKTADVSVPSMRSIVGTASAAA